MRGWRERGGVASTDTSRRLGRPRAPPGTRTRRPALAGRRTLQRRRQGRRSRPRAVRGRTGALLATPRASWTPATTGAIGTRPGRNAAVVEPEQPPWTKTTTTTRPRRAVVGPESWLRRGGP